MPVKKAPSPFLACAAHHWRRDLAPRYRCLLCGRYGRLKGRTVVPYSDNYQLDWMRRQGIELIDARNRAHDEHLAFMERRRMEE